MSSIPNGLRGALEQRGLALWLGAGVSVESGMPTGAALARSLSNEIMRYQTDYPGSPDLEKVAADFEVSFDRPRLAQELQARLGFASPREIGHSHLLVARLIKHQIVDTVVTTNYDTLLEDACHTLGVPLDVVVHDAHRERLQGRRPVLIKLHADFDHPEYLVVTKNDYAQFASDIRRRAIRSKIDSLVATSSIFYLGYAAEDIDLLESLARMDRGGEGPRSYMAVRVSREIATVPQRLQRYGIDAFPILSAAETLADLARGLNIPLNIGHLAFTYPAWYGRELAPTYGGIETLIDTLKRVSKHSAPRHNHFTLDVWSRNVDYMAGLDPRVAWPSYPSSYFYFRFLTLAAAQEILLAQSEKGVLRSGSYEQNIPDVIHVHFLSFAADVSFTGVPVLCTSHSLLSTDLAFARGMFDNHGATRGIHEVSELANVERQACERLPLVTALSDAHGRELSKLGARNVRKIRPPFDPSVFRSDLSAQDARRETGIPLDRFTIAYVGRPDRRKGIEVLVEACEHLLAAGHDVQLLIVGSGFSLTHESLSFAFGRFSVSLSSELAGRTTQQAGDYEYRLPRLYKAADVIAVPSIYEPLGYVVLEAMASGRCVVASNTGGIQELVSHEHTGLLFEPGNSEELAEAIMRVKSDAELRSRLERNAQSYIQSTYGERSPVAELNDLYQRLAFGFDLMDSSLDPAAFSIDIDSIVQQRLAENDPHSAVDRLVVASCRIYGDLLAARRDMPFGEDIAVDFGLLDMVAARVHSYIRREGRRIVPLEMLREMMRALLLAYLNSDRDFMSVEPLTAQRTLMLLQRTQGHMDWKTIRKLHEVDLSETD